MMTCNVGGVERAIRIVVGLMLVALGLFGGMPTAAAWTIGVIGGVATVTGAIGFCPAWRLFGIDTCGAKPAEKP